MKKSCKAKCSEENVNNDDSDTDLITDATKSDKNSISINNRDPEDESLASDDSDAPAGVSWKDSKVVFQQDNKNRNDAVNFARSAEKAKRRKKNEMFISQKEAKRKYELTKLPDDIVHAVIKKPKKPKVKRSKEGNNKKLERKKNKKKSKDTKIEEEYCHVVILQDELNKSKKVQESAAEFLKNHLYGKRLQRTSASTQLTLQCKSSGIMKPAVKFNAKLNC